MLVVGALAVQHAVPQIALSVDDRSKFMSVVVNTDLIRTVSIVPGSIYYCGRTHTDTASLFSHII